MDIKEVITFNIKAMASELNIEKLSGNVEKQSFYKGALYAFRGLLAHPILKELPKTPTNKQSDVIPLWRVRDVLQGHFDYKTVNIVMDDME